MFTVKIMLDKGAVKPDRAHRQDAGLDIYSRETKPINAHSSAVFDTGVHVEIPDGYVGLLASRSGLNIHHGLTSEGVIDAGYTGSVRVKLYNNSDVPYYVCAGDKISQLIILPMEQPALAVVDSLAETERGNAGFGSTGR